MKFIRKKVGFVSIFMAAVTLLIAVPYQPLLAAMVPTDVPEHSSEPTLSSRASSPAGLPEQGRYLS